MKVYIVTIGSYSDYNIDSVFTDKDEAESYLRELSKVESRGCDIAEFECDVPQTKIARPYWVSEIDLLTGNIEIIDRVDGANWHEWAEPGVRSEWVEDGVKPAGEIYENLTTLHGPTSRGPFIRQYARVKSYVSQEHASKVAAELRQSVLRRFNGNLKPSEVRYFLRVAPG